MFLVEIIEIINKHKMWGLVLLLVVIIWRLLCILLDEDKSTIWRARFYEILYLFSKKRELEKKYIENDISGRLNLARRQMPFGKDLLPKSVKVEWVQPSCGESYVPKEGELIVKIDPVKKQEKNIVYLAQALIHRTALIGIRYILSNPLETAIDMNLIKGLLQEIGNRRILDWYLKHEYMPLLGEQEVKSWNSKIVDIDERGLFSRLLLVELDGYGKKIAGRPATNIMYDEIVGLIDFLHKIATKNYGENAPLDYITANIKIGVLIIGETSKILSSVEPYIKAFVLKLNRQPEAIYVTSFSKEFLKEKDEEYEKIFEEMRDYLHQRIEKEVCVEKDFELAYTCFDIKGRKRKAKCIRYIPVYKT